jgi:mycothiol system anti-sigma-R factor
MTCREVMDRLSPFLDDELDPVTSGEIARHVDSCPDCATSLEGQRTLSANLRREIEYHRAPDPLRARLMRHLRAEGRSGGALVRPARSPWRWLGAAAAIVTVAGGTWLFSTLTQDRADGLVAQEVVSSHIRSLMASHLTDVASTDQHTVKPWFAGRLDFSPPVTDFAAAGYPLVGGRLDYLQGHPVAALVYLRRKHTINVFVWPGPDAHDRLAPAVTRQGYQVVHGCRSGMTFWTVSDLNAEELTGFARMFAARAAPGP